MIIWDRRETAAEPAVRFPAKPNGLMDRFRGPLPEMPFMPALRAYSGLRPREAISQTAVT